MTTSERTLYVYLQRPDNAQWVVVGRYQTVPESVPESVPNLGQNSGMGQFRYADSYLDAGLTWAIDPINLPLLPKHNFIATRYQGLHDVLRDACPDAWGQALLRHKHELPQQCTPLRFLTLAGNEDRWGALAVGPSKKPSVAHLRSPRLPQLEDLSEELLALAQGRPPHNAALRKRLFATPSLGGARPKAVIADQDDYWLVKPGLPTDTVDLALLEHATLQWGRAAGLNFADSRHHPLHSQSERSVVRIQRFDRIGEQRIMTISAAALLQLEYPPDLATASYPRLAEALRRIGAPPADLRELFGRMVFNAVVGNNDDHPRNHAAIYCHSEGRWRLAPAFDVVPDPESSPQRLAMQLCVGRWEITRDNLLADFLQFGFGARQEAGDYLNGLLREIEVGFGKIAPILNEGLRRLLQNRLVENRNKLR